MTSNKSGHSLWGGRFSAKPDALMQAINVSIGFDQRLAPQDLAGSRAHAAMLIKTGVISAEDERAIQGGLAAIEAEMAAGTFPFREEFEDHLRAHRCRAGVCFAKDTGDQDGCGA